MSGLVTARQYLLLNVVRPDVHMTIYLWKNRREGVWIVACRCINAFVPLDLLFITEREEMCLNALFGCASG